MFNRFLLKSVACFAIFSGIQYAHAGTQTINFYFVYGPGVSNVKFDHSNNVSSPNKAVKNVSTYNYSDSSETLHQYKIAVKADIKKGNPDTTGKFNEAYSSTALMAGGTSEDTAAQNLDFSITGKAIIINGITLSDQFTIAHENYSSSRPGNWWVAGGNTNSSVIRFSDGSAALELTDSTGQNTFCLNQYGKGEVNMLIASAGKCSNIGYVSYHFNFIYRKNIESVEFIPEVSQSYPESGQIFSKFSTESLNNYNQLTINAVPQNSKDIANSFSQIVWANRDCSGGAGKPASHFLVYKDGFVCGPNPETLDFFITGYIKINGDFVKDGWQPLMDDKTAGADYNDKPFILAEGQNRWWFGTFTHEINPSAFSPYFDNYKPGVVGYNNRAQVHTVIEKRYAYYLWHKYVISSHTKNSFTVN